MLMFFFPKASPNKPITPGLSSFSIIKTFPSGTTSIACWFSLVKIGFFFPKIDPETAKLPDSVFAISVIKLEKSSSAVSLTSFNLIPLSSAINGALTNDNQIRMTNAAGNVTLQAIDPTDASADIDLVLTCALPKTSATLLIA